MAYTNIDDPSAHFQGKQYAGTSGTQNVTWDGNSDMQPDLLWGRNITYVNAYYGAIADSTRGTSSTFLFGRTTQSQSDTNYFNAFNSNGFGVGINNPVNHNGYENAVWGWKANGGTTSSNTDGSVTSTVQANTDAGFSIVTWPGQAGSSHTVGHGLGVKPEYMLLRAYDYAVSGISYTEHHNKGVGGGNGAATHNSNSWTDTNVYFGDTEPTSSVFTVGTHSTVSPPADRNMVAYCWHSVQGYSKFGSYEGNANANGPFVYTGFTPKLIIIKAADTSEQWIFISDALDDTNPNTDYVMMSTNETQGTDGGIDLLSNGFKLRNSSFRWNHSGTMMYMAWAEHPFTTSTGVPTTAR